MTIYEKYELLSEENKEEVKRRVEDLLAFQKNINRRIEISEASQSKNRSLPDSRE